MTAIHATTLLTFNRCTECVCGVSLSNWMKNCSATKWVPHSHFSAFVYDDDMRNRIPKTILSVSRKLLLDCDAIHTKTNHIQMYSDKHRFGFTTHKWLFLGNFPTFQRAKFHFAILSILHILQNILAISINWCWKDINIWLNFF